MTTHSRPSYRFDHVGITVPDLEAAIGFFCEHLDATLDFRLDRFVDESGVAPSRLGAPAGTSFGLAMLSIGDARIELLQWWIQDTVSSPRSPRPPHQLGAAHLALAVNSVPESYATLGAVPGVRPLGSPVTFHGGATPGLTNAFVETPWGLLLELMSWPE